MADVRGRELERQATSPEGVMDLIRHLAREGMFFVCEECGACVPPQARDRHDYEHEYHRHLEAEKERIKEVTRERWKEHHKTWQRERDNRAEKIRKGETVGMQIVPIPPPMPGMIAARPRNEPLYHRLMVSPSDWTRRRIRFFHDPSSGQSNLQGASNSLPAASHFYAYGLSLIPDEGADPESLRVIRDKGQVWFLLGSAASSDSYPSYISNDLPARAVVSQRFFLAREVLADPDNELAGLVPMHRLSIQGLPVELLALQCFGVDLLLPAEVIPTPIGPIGLMCVLHGLRLTGLTG